MATLYQVADGHDNTAGYAALSVQTCVCPGVRYDRKYPISGIVYDDGEGTAVLRFRNLRPAEYGALLTDFALTAALHNDITITLPAADHDPDNFDDFNARVIKPQPDFDGRVFPLVEFVLRDIEAAS